MYKNFKEFLNERDAYLNEARNSSSSGAKYKPTSKDELRELVIDNSINLGDIDVSAVTDMSFLFHMCWRKDFSGVENWDVSNVKDTHMMFAGCDTFNEPIGNWNVSKVTDMDHMFSECTKFNQPLNNWNVSSVVNMSGMFRNCENFNQPLDKWNVSKVTKVNLMFKGCRNFNQDLSVWEKKYRINLSKTGLDNLN